MHAMCLTQDQRMSVAAPMESHGKGEVLGELKMLSAKLLDPNTDKVEDESFINQASVREKEQSDGSEEETDDVLLMQKRMAKSKNRGGNIEKEVKDTRGVYGTHVTDMVRHRCQKTGHRWGNCPLPFGKNLVFPKAKASGGASPSKSAGKGKSGKSPKGGKGGWKVFWVDYPEEEAALETNVVSEQSNESFVTVSDGQAPDVSVAEPLGEGIEFEECCYDEYGWCGDAFVLDEVITCDLWKTSSLATQELYRQGGLIDSGASVSVCSQKWLKQWDSCCTVTVGPASNRIFRFGDGPARESKGVSLLQRSLVCIEDESCKVDASFPAEVIEGNIPLLIAYATLCSWKCGLDFGAASLLIKGKTLRLGVSASGHAYVKMIPQLEKTEDIHATENDEVPNAQPSVIENPVAGSG